jgi:hypothetical protein
LLCRKKIGVVVFSTDGFRETVSDQRYSRDFKGFTHFASRQAQHLAKTERAIAAKKE